MNVTTIRKRIPNRGISCFSHEINDRKDAHAKDIRATGNNWIDAVLRRVELIKTEFNMISSFPTFDQKCTFIHYAYEEIEDLRELGFEANRYANQLVTTLDNICLQFPKY